MSEGLKALKEAAIQIVQAFYGKDEPLRNDKINELMETKQFKIIKKELKEKEKIERALEIIKKKAVNVAKLMICFSFKEYNKYICNEYRLFPPAIEEMSLTEEEYDLLKEVLGE